MDALVTISGFMNAFLNWEKGKAWVLSPSGKSNIGCILKADLVMEKAFERI